MENKVLASIAGRQITEADLDAFIKGAPKEQQAYAAHPQFRAQVLEQLTALYLFAQMGADEKLDETDMYKRNLENAKRDILAQVAMTTVLGAIEVSEEEAQEYYAANGQQFSKGASVSAKHILVDNEEKCSEILEKIVSGEISFEDAAGEHSSCPSGKRGGDLGEFGKGQMVREFEEAAFAAEIGHVVGPVKTQFGYHLIKVEKKTEASVIPFEEVKDRIFTLVRQQKEDKAYSDKVKELKEKYLDK